MLFWTWLIIAEWVIRLVMVGVILRRRITPEVSLAWLAIIFLSPEVGVVAYLLVGTHQLGRKRIKLHRQVIDMIRADPRLAVSRPYIWKPEIEPSHHGVILQAEEIGGMPILGGNNVELISDSDQMIDRMVADINLAQYHVHLLFYIYADDSTGRRVTDALLRAQKRRVACRVLVDAAGSRPFFKKRGPANELLAAGVEVYAALPVSLFRRGLARIDLRNHRKLAIIDGRIAYTGSQNIVNPDYGRRGRRKLRWIDLSGRFTGPVAAQLQVVFLEDWLFETGQTLETPDILPAPESAGDMASQVVPTGPSEDDVDALPRLLLTAIHSAQRRILITSPYLVPDEPTMLALLMAADRGVEVTLVLPRYMDMPVVAAAGRSFYDRFLSSGVHIYLYQGGLLHSKTMTVDDSFALLGSSNMDVRSFYLNFEVNVLMYGPQITRELRFAQTSYLAESKEVDLASWRKRSTVLCYFERAAALLSPLL